MKTVEVVLEESTFTAKGDKGNVDVIINYPHVEMIMEDGTILLFNNVDGYYTLIGDANLYIAADMDVNIEQLEAEAVEDTIATPISYKGRDISAIKMITYHNYKIYHI